MRLKVSSVKWRPCCLGLNVLKMSAEYLPLGSVIVLVRRRLLEKQQRVDAIALQLEQSGADAAQRQELEEMITPPERATLSKVKHCNNK